MARPVQWQVLLVHSVIAMVLAGCIVALPMGQCVGFIPWLIVVSIACIGEAPGNRRSWVFATYVAVTALIVIAAILAPVKTVDRVLDLPIQLPKTAFTLAELDRNTNYESAHWVPRHIHVEVTPQNADTEIKFRAQEITLREFIQTIEAQSQLRHRFSHCGNGSSILYGGDCSFGLFLE